MDGGVGLLGAIVLAAGFTKRKTQLDACSRGKVAETTVTWTAAGGTMSKVKAEGATPRWASAWRRPWQGRLRRCRPCAWLP